MESLIHALNYCSCRLDRSFAVDKREPSLLYIGAPRIAQYNVFAVPEKQRTTNQRFHILDIFGEHRLTDAQSSGCSPKVQLLGEGNHRLH